MPAATHCIPARAGRIGERFGEGRRATRVSRIEQGGRAREGREGAVLRFNVFLPLLHQPRVAVGADALANEERGEKCGDADD